MPELRIRVRNEVDRFGFSHLLHEISGKNTYPKLVAEYPALKKAWEEKTQKERAAGASDADIARIPKPEIPKPAWFFPGDYDPALAGREHAGANFQRRIQAVPPFAIRGIVWDQGECGTGMAGVDQSALLPALVREWRAAWGNEHLPFLYVEKKMHPLGLREAMASLPVTAFVPYEGLNTSNHPPDKSAYARRLVERMEELVYRPSN